MNLQRHIAVLRPAWGLILGAVIAAVALSFAVSSILPRTYESRATLYVGQPLDRPALDYSGLLASQIVANTYARLATTRPLLEVVIEKLGLATTADLLFQNVTTDVPLEETLLVIIARDSSPEGAAAIANEVANQLLARAPKSDQAASADLQQRLAELEATISRLQTEADALQALSTRTPAQSDRLDVLEERLVTFNQARATLLDEINRGSPNALSLVDPAVPSTSPVAPSRVVIVGFSAIAALAGAILLVYVIDGQRSPPEMIETERRRTTRYTRQ